MKGDDIGIKDRLFRAGLLAIERKYIDYFTLGARLQDNCCLMFVKATNTTYFGFLENSTVRVYIKMECKQLFEEIFGTSPDVPFAETDLAGYR